MTFTSCPGPQYSCNPSFQWKVASNHLSYSFPPWWTDKTGVYLIDYHRLYHTTDGATWTYSVLPVKNTCTSIGSFPWNVFGWGESPDDNYIGYKNSIMHFDGITWTTSLTLPSDEVIYAGIAGNNSLDIYAMAATISSATSTFTPSMTSGATFLTGLVLYHVTGSSWTPVTTLNVGHVSLINVFGPNVYIAVNSGAGALLYRYDGVRWSSESENK